MGVKNFRKVFAGDGQKILFLWRGCIVVGEEFYWGVEGHRIFEENLKLHNPSIKSIFRTTS